MLILGLNAFHADSATCILRDGQLIAAAEEERFRRDKHWAGFPSQAIAYCLAEARCRLSDIDHVAINQDGRAHLWRKLAYVATRRPDPAFILKRIRNRQARGGVRQQLESAFPNDPFRGRVHAIEHHLAHLVSAYHVSPFADAAVVSVDGFGDFSSAAWGFGTGSSLDVSGRVFFPHSLGIFYQALTQFVGFPYYGDEYKVMGLAPYGEPRYVDAIRKIVSVETDGTFRLDLSYFRHHREDIAFEWRDTVPTFGTIFSDALEDLLGPARKPGEDLTQRHRDIARSVQAVYEEVFFSILDHLAQTGASENIAIAGGCGANSVANGKIRRSTRFKRVYVQSAAGDAGGAIGSAFAVWHNVLNETSRFSMEHAYWGPGYSDADYAELVDAQADEITSQGCVVERIESEAQLFRKVAEEIAAGKVTGWFQGRMEWGPRALGNRSIVCDPRRADMQRILNLKIKRRESFRPFAPSVLDSAVSDWFEEDDSVPFMMQVFQIREEKRQQIPAVTHVDGSGRLQTVYRNTNPRYYGLIEAFRDLTGVPMVLNTSFNENEPVVCTPKEALDCFLRTKMDLLVLGDFMIRRVAEEAHS